MAAKKKSGTDRMLVMLEHIQDQVQLLAEGQGALRDEIKEQLTQMEARLLLRIEVLETVVREHTVLLQGHGSELHAIRTELELLATRADLRALERRVATLEAQLGV